MTHNATLIPDTGKPGSSPGTTTSPKHPNKLAEAVARHLAFERASFHTPGHKGRIDSSKLAPLPTDLWQCDLTELPGLDELSSPKGVLADLERRAARLWGAAESMISINGASAGLAAAMLAIAQRGSKVLVPRNAHRSVIHGLILSGLIPIWYEPVWDVDWSIWGAVPAVTVERLLEQHRGDLAGLVVVSPTYAGALSDLEAAVQLCKARGVPMVIDEAHGSHFLPGAGLPPSAVQLGADIVVQSLHKTLTSLTQTGLVHIGHNAVVDAGALRAALSLMQTSSPSYLLLASVEQAISALEGSEGLAAVERLCDLSSQLRELVAATPGLNIYSPASGVDPAHVLVGVQDGTSDRLFEMLCHQGIFAEAILGRGMLLLLGMGSDVSDLACLRTALMEMRPEIAAAGIPAPAFAGSTEPNWRRPTYGPQVLSPRQASMLPSQTVPVGEAVGRISAETIAPCPPGTAVVVAGQRVPSEILEFASLQSLRVVIE